MMFVRGTAWIGAENGEDWAENEAAVAEVQRSDENEVHLGIRINDEGYDDVTLYLTVAEASRLSHMLGIACLAHEAAAYEAAKY